MQLPKLFGILCSGALEAQINHIEEHAFLDLLVQDMPIYFNRIFSRELKRLGFENNLDHKAGE